jgi:geranylgeranyl diphosphate synthase type II
VTARVNDKEAGDRVGEAANLFFDTLAGYRDLVLNRILEIVPKGGRYERMLYQPMLEYPLREGKGFRPALCLAICQACGGKLAHALDSAAALELFHNAFLIHDDIEDASETRRGLPTLHAQHGVAAATNIGDALNTLALRTLLGNTGIVGLERSLVIINDVSRMARESTEGQAMELNWISLPDHRPLGLRDYLTMTRKKTTWYTCIAPMRLGAIIADVPGRRLGAFIPFGFRVGAAFQIQDDVLNLVGDEALYGKELAGDIAEGKRTLMAIHAMASAAPETRARLAAIYGLPRVEKTSEDIRYVRDAMEALGSIDFARDVAMRLTASARRIFESQFRWIPPGPHRGFVEAMIDYMASRRF